jgi:hypothetical protein
MTLVELLAHNFFSKQAAMYVRVHCTPSLAHPVGRRLDSLCKYQRKVVTSSPTHTRSLKELRLAAVLSKRCLHEPEL